MEQESLSGLRGESSLHSRRWLREEALGKAEDIATPGAQGRHAHHRSGESRVEIAAKAAIGCPRR
jgi:hypothetical protein